MGPDRTDCESALIAERGDLRLEAIGVAKAIKMTPKGDATPPGCL